LRETIIFASRLYFKKRKERKMAKKIKNMLKNNVVLCVLIVVVISVTSIVFAADVKIQGGKVKPQGLKLPNDTYLTADNYAGTGTVNLIKANTSDVAVIPDGSELASSAAPTADADIANKKYVDDNVGGIGPAWSTWATTLEQSGSVTHTVDLAKYVQIGKLCIVTCNLTVTGSGTAGNTIVVGNLPVAISGAFGSLGSGKVIDTSTLGYCATVGINTSTSVLFIGWAQGNAIGVTPSFALASGDKISFMIMYETE
jgi:hypothetical protein